LAELNWRDILKNYLNNNISKDLIETINKKIYNGVFPNEPQNLSANYKDASNIITIFKQNNKHKVYGNNINTYSNIKSWILENNDESNIIECEFFDNIIRIIFANKNLLKKFPNDDNLALSIDGTYKLSLNDYPLIVIGIISSRIFNPLSLTIVNKENWESYNIAIKKTLQILKDTDIELPKIKYIISDDSDSISKALKENFKHSYRHIHCLFNIEKNVKKQINEKL